MGVQRTLLASLCLLTTLGQALAEDLYEAAAAAARQGDHVLMQERYEAILAARPNDLRALSGKATAQAWRGNYYAAVETWRKVLAADPDNIEALIGAGYAFAWAGDHRIAGEHFERALAIAPGSVEARKGNAYVALWSGDTDVARARFEQLTQERGGDPELAVALGQAELQEGHARSALRAFDHALALDPGRADASAGRQAALGAPPRLEASAWYGSTTNAGAGLRQLEFAWWAGGDTRLAARYDDSLSLDNPAIARRGESAETWMAGVRHRFGGRLSGVLEAGVRSLPDGDQDLVRGEVILERLPGRVTLGAQVGSHDLGYDDELYYFGIGIPVAGRWQVESNNYFSTTGVARNDEWRSVLNVMYAAEDGWDLLVGAGLGEVDRGDLVDADRVGVAHAMFTMPVLGYHRLHFVVRHEDLPAGSTNIAMVGFTWRLPR